MAEAASTGDQYSQAVGQLRTTATWLVTTAGAVGAIVIAGLQLKSIGGLHDLRLAGAVGAAIVSVTALGAAIWQISQVLLPIASSPQEIETGPEFAPLREAVAKDQEILQGEGGPNHDLAGLHAAFSTAVDEALTAYRRVLDRPGDEERQTVYSAAAARLDRVRGVLNDVEGYGTYLAVAARFKTARLVMLGAAVLVAAMAALFAYCANPPKPPNPPKAQSRSPATGAAISTPPVVHVRLTAQGKQELRPELGRRCKLAALRAVVLGGASTSPEIVTVPRRGCRARRLVLLPSLGATASRR